MKSNRRKGFLLFFLFSAVIILGGYFFLFNQETDPVPPAEVESESVAVTTLNQELPTEEADEKEEEDLKVRENTFGGQTVPREEAFMDTLHKMTHQKVMASPKWGVMEVTEERISEMIRILDETQYDHELFYREALELWMQGDFSNAVEVHNYIWNLQGGTVGEAKRLLTPEEEATYIEQYIRE